MTSILSVLMVVIAVAFVGWPFWRDSGMSRAASEARMSALERRKRDALAAIKEAEFDFQTGKLSEQDLQLVTQKYKRIALEAMNEAEKHATQSRSRKTHPAGQPRFCPFCGIRTAPGGRFCGSCGATLKKVA